MSFPLADWQFWSVTAAALGSVWLLVRPFLQRDAGPAGPCGSCAQSHGGRCASSGAGKERPGRDRLVVLGDRR